ncbi:chemotaxis protein CheW [Novosphingobium terrae]|uniref:chemotaxis protein CheW n=1 Tax=Novosphingobium terrae TaxID=2726189 RepID=UPI00197FA484|nr:chemotaxis protein CheW [Novosphingobium terrae]
MTEAALAIDACWKSIGVQGDQSCRELAALSHCRNCPVFSRQAARLLDRETPDDTPLPAIPAAAAEPAERGQSVTIFRLGAEWFALPTLVLDEIVPARAVHSLPHRRDPGLLGLVNVRGELVVCVSIARAVLGEGGIASTQGRIIVARHESGRFAFPVDEVAQTLHHAPGAVLPLPATLAHSTASLTKGLLLWREHRVGLLDAEALFAALNRCLI